MRLARLLAAACVAATFCSPCSRAAEAPGKPNIVVILADDVGYGDLGCYGATKVKTPNLDRLAGAGLRFTDAHAPASVCTPTRYALLTGQYAWRHKPGSTILSGVAPYSIPANRLTLPQLLQKAGYATGCVGKWHLGLGEGETDYNREIRPGPLEAGFDYSFIIPATGDRTPCVYVENRHVAGYDPADPIRVNYREKIGNEPTGREHPELLKMKHSKGHDMTIVNGIGRIGWMTGGRAARWRDEDMADTITRKAVGFIEKNREKPFFLYFATHDIHVPRVPHPRFRGTSQCGTRGDVLQEMDACVGEVLGALDRLKLADNTLVIFSSDNGGVLDDGYQDGAVEDLNGHRPNGPLRAFKGSLYEGGHREPFIARWPGKVRPGVSDQLVSLVDLMATCAVVVGRELPADAAPDSFNILPALLGESTKPVRDHLIMYSNPGQPLAIRQGPWKLIPPATTAAAKKKGLAMKAQLFNLADDLAETKNLAAQQPERVKAMTALIEKIRGQGRSRP